MYITMVYQTPINLSVCLPLGKEYILMNSSSLNSIILVDSSSNFSISSQYSHEIKLAQFKSHQTIS